MSLKIITAPVTEPLTVAEAKAHLRVDVTDDDAYITALIASARQGAEHITGRALMPQTLELALSEFPRIDCRRLQDTESLYFDGGITLPRPPLVTIASIKYLDDSGVLQTMATDAYLLDDHSEPARLIPAYGTSWPSTRYQPNAVLIQYQAGYSSAGAVPEIIKSWMLLRIGKLYAHRESVVAGVSISPLPEVDLLLDAYRVWNA